MSQQFAINYDTRNVGQPYLRGFKITIEHPLPGSGASTSVTIGQQWAVRLEGGAFHVLAEPPSVPSINTVLDTASQTTMPLIDPASSLPIDAATRSAIAGAVNAGVITMPIAMLCIMAVTRHLQQAANTAQGA